MAFFHPQFLGNVNATFENLPEDPDQATAVTIARMQEFMLADSHSELVKRAVIDALPGQLHSFSDLCCSLMSWIRAHVVFVRDSVPALGAGFREDPESIEVLIRPIDILRMPQPAGDCDDHVMLAGAMLLCAAEMLRSPIQVYAVTVAADARHPDQFSHVYLYAVLDHVVIPIDASHAPRCGVEVPNRFNKKQIWPIGGRAMFAQLGHLGDAAVLPWWQDLLKTGVQSTFDIVKQVTLPRGTFVQNAAGDVRSRDVPYATPSVGINLSTPSGSGVNWLVVGAVAIGAIALFKSQGR